MHYKRNRGLTVKDFWFVEDRCREEETGADFAQYHDMCVIPNDIDGLMVQQNRQTLINNLLESEDEIVGRFKKNTKYEIKRAEKERCYCVQYTAEELVERLDILKRVDTAHKQMFADKGKKSKSEYATMLAAAKESMLHVSIGYLPSGEECAYHVYIVGNGVARLLHSITLFRKAESNDVKHAIGRLNRLLHYEDMLWFKEHGYCVYDWGGYSEEEHLKSISDFKKAFGGDIVNRYSMIYTTSPLGKLVSYLVRSIKFKGK